MAAAPPDGRKRVGGKAVQVCEPVDELVPDLAPPVGWGFGEPAVAGVAGEGVVGHAAPVDECHGEPRSVEHVAFGVMGDQARCRQGSRGQSLQNGRFECRVAVVDARRQ